MSYPSYAYPTPSYDDIPNFAPNYYGSNMQPYYNQQVYTGFEGTDATKWIEDNK